MDQIIRRLNVELIRGNSRLLRERPTWYNNGDIYNLLICKVGSSELDYDVEVKFDYYSNNKFIYTSFFSNFKNKYPFSPPKIIINGKIYDGVINFSNEILDMLHKRWKISCLCCSSLLTRNNWKPTNGLIDILEEYIQRRDIIYNYHNYKLVVNYSAMIIRLPDELKNIILDFLIAPLNI